MLVVQGCGCGQLEPAESWQALPASCATVTPGNVNPTAPTVEMKERQKHPTRKTRVPDALRHDMFGSSYHQGPTYCFHGHLTVSIRRTEGWGGIISYIPIFLDSLSWISRRLYPSSPVWFTTCFKIPHVYYIYRCILFTCIYIVYDYFHVEQNSCERGL